MITMLLRLRVWFNRTGSETVGWLLVVIGILMMIMPGPGMITLVAGVAFLSRHYEWAQLILDPLHRKAAEGMRLGVATIPRILVSALGVAAVAAVGVVWWMSPQIPVFTIWGVTFGPALPAGGWLGGVGILFSASLGAAALIYSIVKYRPEAKAARKAKSDQGKSDQDKAELVESS